MPTMTATTAVKPSNNFITRLQRERANLIDLANQAATELELLRHYLCSPKFHVDTTVQVADVLRRTDDLRSMLHEAAKH